MTAISSDNKPKVDEATYSRRIRAWILYDWANSAFVTTVIAAFLPVYYSDVAGATLPSRATATAYWSLTLSVSIFIVAMISPILGTVADVMRGKKRFLAIFVLIGIIGAGLLVFVGTGDWLLASLFFVLGRIGFAGANVFYDALLPHVAEEPDRDRVSSRGFALGYLGGGILLAINVVMFIAIPDTLFEFAGIRLSFLSVSLWWLVFSIPILRVVPEPPSHTEELQAGETVIGVSFRRVGETLRKVRQYSELFKFLVAFLIYIEPVNTIIGLAAIYGAELGFGTIELILALLLVQFVGVPFTLIYGQLPSKEGQRRHLYLAYIVFNLVMLPSLAIAGRFLLPMDITGNQPPPYETTADFYGEGTYALTDEAFVLDDTWSQVTVTGEQQAGEGFLASLAGTPEDSTYLRSDAIDAQVDLALNGQTLVLTHDVGPDRGTLAVLVGGEPLLVDEMPLTLDFYNPIQRFNVTTEITLPEPAQTTLSLVNSAQVNADSSGTVIALSEATVQPPVRVNSLPLIIAALFAVQLLGVVFALVAGRFFKELAAALNTRRAILLAILIYSVIAVWGFFLDSTIEFWFLAWLVATSQGGIQALSRSLFASLAPSSQSGEFFGLFSILSKGASVLGASLFAAAALLFDSSRPAILSLIVLFIIGTALLLRVNIEEGRRVARETDAAVYGAGS